MTPGVLPMAPKQRESSEWVGEISPRPKKLQFQRSRIKTLLIIFFDSQGIVHKEFVPEGKTVYAEFYKGVKDRLLKRIQHFRPVAFCSRDFFLVVRQCARPQSCVCNFLTPKKLQPLITPAFSRFISTRLFFVPKVENKVKRTLLCGCCGDPRNCN